jgi:glyceraldehyde 3-phosphate dehydrogenase
MKYDSIRGIFNGDISIEGSDLIVNGNKIELYSERNPAAIPWKHAGVEYVVDSTGIFTKEAQAAAHLSDGVKKVIICSPSVDAPMFVMGVNESSYNGSKVISGASCTTNATSPLVKVINDKFTIVEALLTTMHAYTAANKLVDGPTSKSLRDGRSAPENIIPSSTNAAYAVSKVLPELRGKISGIAMIVPISSVSVVDLTCRVEKDASFDDLKNAIREAAYGCMKGWSCAMLQGLDDADQSHVGILAYTDDDVVSSDMKDNPNSCVFDAQASIALNKNFFKLVGWYDHQWAYSNRVLELIAYIDAFDAETQASHA